MTCQRKRRTDSSDILTKEFLEVEYSQKLKQIKEISEETGYSRNTIRRSLRRLNIETRKVGTVPEERKLNRDGQKFGCFTILSKFIYEDGVHFTYKCQCECGNITNLGITSLKRIRKNCQKCQVGKKHFTFTGHEEIYSTFWSMIINGAISRNMEFSISIEYAWELFIKQDRKCALSGMDIVLKTEKGRYNYKNKTASLDRIDSTKGYIEGNVQWVHKDINVMKNKFSEDYLFKLCSMIVNKRNGIKNEI